MPIPEGSTVRDSGQRFRRGRHGRETAHLTTYDVTPWETQHDDLTRCPERAIGCASTAIIPPAVTDTLVDDPKRSAPTLRRGGPAGS